MEKIKVAYLLFCIFILASCGGSDNSVPDGKDETGADDKTTISWTPEKAVAGSEITFTVNAEGDIRSVLWTFGDNSSQTVNSSTTVKHTYNNEGNYNVKAYVMYASSKMDEISVAVTVYNTNASISVSNDYPARMEKVSFSLNQLSDVKSVTWDFGDSSSKQNVTSPADEVTHQYAKDGTYKASVEIVYTNSSVTKLQKDITVEGESLSYSSENFDKSKVWIMAHRGNYDGGYGAAPNSISGFKKCAELGYVDFVEVDVQITKDGKVICIHDDYLSRFTDYGQTHTDKGLIGNMTLDEIRKYKLKTTDGKVTTESVPTLEEVLMTLRGKIWFNLDKCGSECASISTVYDVVKKCGCLDRTQFYVSMETDNEKWLSEQKAPGIISAHSNSSSQLNAVSVYKPLYIIQVTTDNAAADTNWLRTLSSANWLTMTNILDNYQTDFLNGNTTVFDSFLGAGLNMVQCDYPSKVYDYLKSKGKR